MPPDTVGARDTGPAFLGLGGDSVQTSQENASHSAWRRGQRRPGDVSSVRAGAGRGSVCSCLSSLKEAGCFPFRPGGDTEAT